MQRILKLLVLKWRISLRVLREAHNKVGNCFRIDGKIAAQTSLEAGFRKVDQIDKELAGAVLVLSEVPDHRAVGYMRESRNSHTIRPEQGRLNP